MRENCHCAFGYFQKKNEIKTFETDQRKSTSASEVLRCRDKPSSLICQIRIVIVKVRKYELREGGGGFTWFLPPPPPSVHTITNHKFFIDTNQCSSSRPLAASKLLSRPRER